MDNLKLVECSIGDTKSMSDLGLSATFVRLNITLLCTDCDNESWRESLLKRVVEAFENG